MRGILALGTWIAVALVASQADAARLLAVLPLDVTHAKNKLDADARDDLEEMLRDVATDALTPSGWTILTGETTLQVLQDNGVDATKCGDQTCHLSMAREIKAEKFLSGNVRFVEGAFSASIRLIDTATGRILATESIEGDSVRALRTNFRSKAHDFFTKGGMVMASGQPAAPPPPEARPPRSSPAEAPAPALTPPPTPSPEPTPPGAPGPTPAEAPAATTVTPPLTPAPLELAGPTPPEASEAQSTGIMSRPPYHHLGIRIGTGGFDGEVGLNLEYRFIRYLSVGAGLSATNCPVSNTTTESCNEWFGQPAPWGGGLGITFAITGYLPFYFHGSPYASIQEGSTSTFNYVGVGFTTGWDWIFLSRLNLRTGIGVSGGQGGFTIPFDVEFGVVLF